MGHASLLRHEHVSDKWGTYMSIPRPGESRKSPPEVGEGDRLTTGDAALARADLKAGQARTLGPYAT